MDKEFDAAFGGCIENEMYIRINSDPAELDGFELGVVDNTGEWKPLMGMEHFSLALLEKVRSSSMTLCLGKNQGDKVSIYRLKNHSIKTSSQYTDEIYDRRELFGQTTEYTAKGKKILPYYDVDGTMMLEWVKEEDVFYRQFNNEIVLKVEDNEKVILFTKCKKVDGNYVGIYPADAGCLSNKIEWNHIEEDKEFVYMCFAVDKCDADKNYEIAWKHSDVVYHAALVQAGVYPAAEIISAKYKEDKKLELTVEWDKEQGMFSSVAVVVIDDRKQIQKRVNISHTPHLV